MNMDSAVNHPVRKYTETAEGRLALQNMDRTVFHKVYYLQAADCI